MESIVDPLNGEPFLSVPATNAPEELSAFVASSKSCPKTGLHNPYKNVERYLMLGRVSARAAQTLRDPVVADFFARLIQRVTPKSYAQAMSEVRDAAAWRRPALLCDSDTV
jgi:1-pyrroline-5-carboxylate dehydrogenase